jgi:hypothetical protein
LASPARRGTLLGSKAGKDTRAAAGRRPPPLDIHLYDAAAHACTIVVAV